MSAAATLTLWAFLGLESATVPATSIEDPDRTIPRATLIGTLLTAIVYVASTVGVMSLVVPSSLGQSPAPFADAGRAVWGEAGATIVALGASISAFGALNGWVLLVGQLPLAVANDGLFPRVFARLSGNGTPTAGMLIAGVLTTALVGLNYTRGLVDLFTFFILLSTLTTLILRLVVDGRVFAWRPGTLAPAARSWPRGGTRVRVFTVGHCWRGQGDDLLGLSPARYRSPGLCRRHQGSSRIATREPRFCNVPSRIVIAGVRPHRAQRPAAFGKIVRIEPWCALRCRAYGLPLPFRWAQFRLPAFKGQINVPDSGCGYRCSHLRVVLCFHRSTLLASCERGPAPVASAINR